MSVTDNLEYEILVFDNLDFYLRNVNPGSIKYII